MGTSGTSAPIDDIVEAVSPPGSDVAEVPSGGGASRVPGGEVERVEGGRADDMMMCG